MIGKKLDKRVKVYLSKLELRMLRKQARDHGLSVSSYLRKLVQRKGEILHDR